MGAKDVSNCSKSWIKDDFRRFGSLSSWYSDGGIITRRRQSTRRNLMECCEFGGDADLWKIGNEVYLNTMEDVQREMNADISSMVQDIVICKARSSESGAASRYCRYTRRTAF